MAQKILKQIVESVWKKMKIGAASALVGAALLMPPNVCSEESDFHFFSNPEGGICYEQSVISEIRDIPLELRNVPRHPDDTFVSDKSIAPIEPDYIGFSDDFWLYGRVKGGVSFNDKIKLSAGYGLDIDLLDLISGCQYKRTRDTVERNYSGHVGTDSRGQGSALTYCSSYPTYFADWNTFLRPNLFSEIELNMLKKTSIAFGCKVYKEQIMFENGWDRYDSFEKRGNSKIADLTIGAPYISLRFNELFFRGKYINLELGFPQIIEKNLTGSGKEMNIKFNDSAWFAKIGSSMEF